MAAIVREEPPPMEEKLPPPLRWIIDRCLAKEPERRYESTRDLYRDLVNLRDHFSEAYTSQAFAPIAPPKAKARIWKVPTLCAASAVLAALLVYLLKPSGQDIGRYRYTPFASDAFSPVWSPDGKAVAYSGKVEGTYQVFVRYLNSPIPMQLTHEKYEVFPAGWSSDKSHLILQQSTGRKESPRYKLLSVATVGGDPEFIMDSDCEACDLSRDGKTFATLAKGKDGSYSVSLSDPLGSPLRPYAPAPFMSKDIFNAPQLNFSADGKYILLYRTGDEDKDEGWLLPFPPGSKPPHRILTKLHTFALPNFSWMPDDRHLVVSFAADQNAPTHLWMADVESNRLTPLTTGTINESVPVVSPDGATILYVQRREQFDVVSVSLEDGSTKTIVSTGREEDMPAWAASQPKLVWVTNRSGPYEIWVRLWISSLSGGAPVRLTNAEPTGEGGGSWSPDGRRVAYLSEQSGKTSLSIARASGNSLPVVVKSNGPPLKDLPQGIPEWSPSGDWITYRDRTGWNLISPDGRSSKFLGDIPSDYLAFSKDGKLLYGIHAGQTEADRNRFTLFSVDPVTLKQRVIKELGSDLRPATGFVMGIRFSLAPDGKSFVYSSENYRHDLWMLQGFRQPDWVAGIGNLLHK
jgi:Tol biopolymer transport system component